MKPFALVVFAAVCLYGQAVTVKVPMRDGVPLATDVYGADPRQPKPVLLTRTPYDKSGQAQIATEYSRHGYVVVVQDCRGRYASGGFYTPYNEDRQDGFDTIEWINRQPWSNGRVGMFGGSHLGLVQWLAMAEKAPGLITIAPAFTASSLYRVAYRDGALRMALISSAGTRAHPPPEERKLPAEIGMLHRHLPLMHLPLARLEEAYGWSLPWMSALLSHPSYSGFWRQTSAEHDIASSEVPVQIVTGYYDFFHHESVHDFFRLRARKTRAPVQLILGPWTHGGTSRSRVQDKDFGADATINVQAVNLAWFNWHLKGKPTPHPLVRYFSMGDNKWHEADAWPPSEATITRLHLGPAAKASFTAPTGNLQPAEFTSDPANPVPSVPQDRLDIDRSALWSPIDYTAVGERFDVVSWTTEPLDTAIRIAGPVKAELHVECDTPDADWIVRLYAVPPAGMSLPLAHGIVRGSFRDSLEKPAPLVPGRRYKLTVDLGSPAAYLERGHRLKVEVAGSSFPLYDRNLHTAAGPFSSKAVVARQKVYPESTVLIPILDSRAQR
jgi:uncharacterized protein